MPNSYRFPLLFMVLYGALQIIYLGSPEWLIKGWLVERITVTPSASLINFLWPDLSVQPSGSRLVSAKGSINVLRGCEGTETMLMLLAAILATGRHWQQRVIGIVSGLLLIYLLNQIRIAGLYWVVANKRELFESVHGYFAPLFIIGLTLLFYLGWLRFSDPNRLTTPNTENNSPS